MSIDLQYLLWLQDLRNATGGIFDEVFNGLSKFAVDILPLLPYLVLWGLSRAWGYRFLLTYTLGDLLNGVVKLTVCAYRPWIRSDKIIPAGDSKKAATGYSFPSGHSLVASTLFGTSAAATWNRKRRVAVLCIALIALTGFSRNFLGVHTPQDVVVGITEGVLMILVIGRLMKWLDGDEKRTNLMTLAGVAAVALVILYISLKDYPRDMVDGKLLVDPEKMKNDCFKACGATLGLMAGSYIERHRIRYTVPAGAPLLPLLSGIGVAIIYAWKYYFADATIVALMGPHWGNLVARFILVFFGLVIWPMVIRSFCGEQARQAA